MTPLQRWELENKITLEPWLHELARLAGSSWPAANIFRHAIFEPGCMTETVIIEDDILREKARGFMRFVAIARGMACNLHEPPTIRDRDARGVFLPEIVYLSGAAVFHVKHGEAPPEEAEEPDMRSSPEARHRMSEAKKVYWRKKREFDKLCKERIQKLREKQNELTE